MKTQRKVSPTPFVDVQQWPGADQVLQILLLSDMHHSGGRFL